MGIINKHKGASFNGRTAVSKTANVGSIPTAPANAKTPERGFCICGKHGALLSHAAGIESSEFIFIVIKMNEAVPRPFAHGGTQMSRGRSYSSRSA